MSHYLLPVAWHTVNEAGTQVLQGMGWRACCGDAAQIQLQHRVVRPILAPREGQLGRAVHWPASSMPTALPMQADSQQLGRRAAQRWQPCSRVHRTDELAWHGNDDVLPTHQRRAVRA